MKRRFTLYVSLVVIFFMTIIQARATHLMGGEVTYKYLGNNKYALKFAMYRDCSKSNAPGFANPIKYYIYPGTNVAKKSWTTYTTRSVNMLSEITAQPVAPHCSTPAGVCIKQGLFLDTITLGTDTLGYHISYGEGNRNTVTNLNSGFGKPNSMYWYAFIPPRKYNNSSPQFLTVPIPFLCASHKTVFNPGVSDPDKDSLVFSLATAYSMSNTGAAPTTPGNSNFTTMSYNSGYSATSPFGGSSTISMDASTGEITATAASAGLYVVAIQVDEYRVNPVTHKAVYLGSIRRDLEFIVQSCSTAASSYPQIQNDTSGYTKYVNPGDSICFNISGAVATSDTLYMTSISGITKDNPTINPPYATLSGTLTYPKKVKGTFCWAPTCDQITYTTPYTITFAVSDQHCNTAYKTYSIYVNKRPILRPVNLRCVDITGANSIKLTWDTLQRDSNYRNYFQQYYIYRDTNNSGNFVVIDSISKYKTLTYTDTKATGTGSIIYSYFLTTQNTCGLEGLESDTLNSIVITSKMLTDKKVRLSWNAQSSRTNTSYKIMNDVGSGMKIIDSTKNLSYIVNACSRTFKAQIRVTDTLKICNSNSPSTGTIVLQDAAAPNATKITSADVIKQGQINIAFARSDSNDTKYYYIYRSTNGGSFVLIDSIKHSKSISTYTYSDVKVDANKNTYCYKVNAKDTCGLTSAYYTTTCPVWLKGTAGQLSSILNWNIYQGAMPVTSQVVQRLKGNTWTNLATLGTSVNSYIDNNLSCTRPFYYRILTYYSSSPNPDHSDTVSVSPFDTVKPFQPVIDNITVSSAKNIKLVWAKSKSADVVKYIVYRKLSTSSTFAIIDTVKTDTFLTDTGLNTKKYSYDYAVVAMDSCGNTGAKSVTHTSMLLYSSTVSCNQYIIINWNTYAGWPKGVKYFDIMRKSTKSPVEKRIARVANNIGSYTDYNINYNEDFTYRIKAMDNAADSFVSYSNDTTSRTYKPVTPVIRYVSKTVTSPTVGKITIKWQSLAGLRHMNYVTLYYRVAGSGAYTVLKNIINVNTTDSFIHSGINTNSKNYDYFLVPTDSCNNLGDSSVVNTSMDFSMTVGQLIHNLKWTAYKGRTVKEYVIQLFQGGSFVDVDSVAGNITAKVRLPAPCNFRIYYRIKARFNGTEYALSDTAGGQAIDTIPANKPILNNATVKDNLHATITFKGSDSADVYGYDIRRSDNGGPYKKVGFIIYGKAGTVYNYTDTANTITKDHNYIIVTLDSCLNESYSDTFRLIHLKGKALNQQNRLFWTTFKGYKIQKYDLQTLDKTGKWVLLQTFKATDTFLLHTPLACYVPRYYRMIGYELGGSGRTTMSDSIKLTPYDSIVPPSPVVHFATVQSASGIKLEWHWDKSSDVKFFDIYRRDSISAFSKIATVKYDSTYLDNTKPYNKAYTYYIQAIDSCNSAHISIKPDTNRTVWLRIATKECIPLARLYWSAYKGLPNKVSNYLVYRSTDGTNYSLYRTLSSKATAFNDSFVTVGKTYWYKLGATDTKSGYTAFSDSVSIVPFVYILPVPREIKRATVQTTGTNGQILIEWQAMDPSDLYGIGYHLYYATKAGGPYTLLRNETDITQTSYLHKGIDTRYGHNYYYLAPYNFCNRESAPSVKHQAVQLNVKGKDLEEDLTWTAYRGFTVDHYEVDKSRNGSSLNFAYSVKASDTTYADTNIVCGYNYTYRVRAIEQGGNNQIAFSDTVIVRSFDKTPPLSPLPNYATVNATSSTAGTIAISFNSVHKKDRSVYVIYRSINGLPFKALDTIKNTNPGVILYNDKNLDTRKSVTSYYLRALDSCGNISLPSDTHTVMKLQAVAQNAQNSITWTDYQGFKGLRYVIQRNTNNGPWQTIDTLDPALVNTYIDLNVRCLSLYQYRIMAIDTLGSSTSFSNTDTARAFESNAPLLPFIKRASVSVTGYSTGEITLYWNRSKSTDVAKYIIYRRTTSPVWVLIATLPNTATNYTDAGLNTYRNTYEYKMLALDSCGNLSTDVPVVHKAVNLSTKSGNERNYLKWTAYQGFDVLKYNLYRDGNLVKSFDSATRTYTDTDLLCIKTYHYVIAAVAMDSSIIALSNKDSLSPYDNNAPKAVHLVATTVSVPNNRTHVSWTVSGNFDAAGYKVYRRMTNTGDYKMVFSTNSVGDTSFTDTVNVKGDQACYKVIVFDYCGNQSQFSNQGCTIILHGEAANVFNKLSWTPYTDWAKGVQKYNIYRMEDSSTWKLIASTKGSILKFDDLYLDQLVTNYCYQIEAIEDQSRYNAFSKSIVVCVQQQPVVWVPNVFTPDRSLGLNDYFGPQGLYMGRYEMKVFNRWGQEMFSTDKSQTWDGKFGGDFVPEGFYMYKIIVYSFDNKPYYYKGVLNIIR